MAHQCITSVLLDLLLFLLLFHRWSPIDSPYQQLNHSTASNTVIQAPVSAPAPPSTEEKNANIEARTVGQQSNTQSSDQKKTPKLNGQKKSTEQLVEPPSLLSSFRGHFILPL